MGKKKKKKKSFSASNYNSVPKRPNLNTKKEDPADGLLVATAREYHLRYAEAIAYAVEFHKHLSVLMPAKIGLFPLPLLLYDGLDFRCREFIIVEEQKDIDVFNNWLISEQNENKCIYPILIDEFLRRRPIGGCYVLFDLSPEKRMVLTSLLADNTDTVVISIGKLSEDEGTAKSTMVSQAHDAINELYQITMKDGKPYCMIFPVESVLDIRDLMHAKASEKTRLVSALYSLCSSYEVDYGVRDQFTNALGNAEKIAQYKKLLAERDFEIAILKSVAASAGVDMRSLEDGIHKVTSLKHEYADKYDQTTDPLEQEKLEAEFQNEVSELLVSATSTFMTQMDRKKYESTMIEHLGETIWYNQLSERSRTYLISSMMTFDAMNSLADRDSLDYSGVCLQVTKVLDEEMTSRFYTLYKRYLLKTCLFDDWPKAMKTRDGDEPLDIKDFTLGTVTYVLGVGMNGRVYDSAAFERVQQFAKAHLYRDGLNDSEIREHLIKCVECSEKTRRDYRNPAAHREAMSYISARECIDYLLEQTKMLKIVLQDMRVR